MHIHGNQYLFVASCMFAWFFNKVRGGIKKKTRWRTEGGWCTCAFNFQSNIVSLVTEGGLKILDVKALCDSKEAGRGRIKAPLLAILARVFNSGRGKKSVPTDKTEISGISGFFIFIFYVYFFNLFFAGDKISDTSHMRHKFHRWYIVAWASVYYNLFSLITH